MTGPDPDDLDPTEAAELLAWAAEAHEPDRQRVIARLGFDPAVAAAETPRPSAHRRFPTRRRITSTFPAGIAAAAAVAVLVGASVVAVTVLAHRPSTAASDEAPVLPATSVPVTAPLSAPAPPTDPGAPTGTPTTSGTPPTSGTAGPPVTTSPVGRPPGTAVPPGPAAPVAAGVRPVATGTAVELGSGTDWIALTRRDGTQVHSATTGRAPAVRWSGATAGSPSPYSVSWSGGAPEQDHNAATTWLALGAGGSVTITVPALSTPATLTLYLGAAGADVAVSGVARGSWSHRGTDPAAAVVTVPIPASGVTSQVMLTPVDSAPSGVVGLAAVVLN